MQANPVALGETDFGLHAQAKFVASVSLNSFLGASYKTNVVDVVAGIALKRCTLTDKETHFRVLGLDVIDPADLPLFDTSEPSSSLAKFTNDCNSAVGEFKYWANRAKKAFRDGQQLVKQFRDLKNVNQLLSPDLCQQIGVLAADVPFFPGGMNCPAREPVEVTINRFIDYYQGSGGQVSQLEQAALELANATKELAKNLNDPHLLSLQFRDKPHQQSETIVSVPFVIGPVPMLLQIDAFARYGVTGGFNLALNFGSIFNLDGKPQDNPDDPNQEKPVPRQIAKVTAGVLPHASAGLSAFVGAGTDLGVFSAAVGIEGAVTIADVQTPIYAGAGLDMIVTKDLRPLPHDLDPPVSLLTNNFQFSIPKSFRFIIEYDYGAAVDLKNVMSGEVNAKLRIKFFFFSRTWRKRVVKFNGWNFHFNLLSGGNSPDIHPMEPQATIANLPQGRPDPSRASAPTFEGTTEVGLSEDQVPLTVLTRLQVPGGSNVSGDTTPTGLDQEFQDPELLAAPGDDAGVASFDASAVQGFFYDDLCCARQNEQCAFSGTPKCCPGFDCVQPIDAPPNVGFCFKRACKLGGEKCTINGDCCQPKTEAGLPMVCGQFNTCTLCSKNGESCGKTSDCCDPTTGCDTVTHTCAVTIVP
jgi:hypothetical protein